MTTIHKSYNPAANPQQAFTVFEGGLWRTRDNKLVRPEYARPRRSKRSSMLRNIILDPYAWPGGYAKFAIMDDGAEMCAACCEANWRIILGSYGHDGWSIEAVDASCNCEELPTCVNCGRIIE